MYAIEITENGRETYTYYDFSGCGDFPECHDETYSVCPLHSTEESRLNDA